jgi:hypothetical protein
MDNVYCNIPSSGTFRLRFHLSLLFLHFRLPLTLFPFPIHKTALVKANGSKGFTHKPIPTLSHLYLVPLFPGRLTSALNMEEACSFEVFVTIYQTTWHHTPEHSDLSDSTPCPSPMFQQHRFYTLVYWFGSQQCVNNSNAACHDNMFLSHQPSNFM